MSDSKTVRPSAIKAASAAPRTKPSNYPEPFFSRMARRAKRPQAAAHQLVNRTGHDVGYLEIGDRTSGDEGSRTMIFRRCWGLTVNGNLPTKTAYLSEPGVTGFPTRTPGVAATARRSCRQSSTLDTRRGLSGGETLGYARGDHYGRASRVFT